eukprot:4915554-Amphidinium_carterae.1
MEPLPCPSESVQVRAVPAISSTQLESIPERRCIRKSSIQSTSEVAKAQPASTPIAATVPDAVMV